MVLKILNCPSLIDYTVPTSGSIKSAEDMNIFRYYLTYEISYPSWISKKDGAELSL